MFTVPCSTYCWRAPLIGALAALSVVLAAAPLLAEEVQIEHNGLTLNADLYLAEGKSIEDGVILMTHAALQHNRMEIVRVFTELFRENGYSTLAMNYSAGLDDRRGPYDCATPHRHTRHGHMEEIVLWIDWLKQRNAGEIILAGHSGGANKIMQLFKRQRVDGVSRVVLFAPGTSDHYGRTAEVYEAQWRRPIEPILERARALVAAGKGDELMENIDFLFCARTSVSARTFLNYYDATDSIYDKMPAQLGALKEMGMPTLIIGAGDDNIAPDMAKLVEPHADGDPVRLVVLEGCGHFFRDLCADDAVETAVDFLEE